MTVVRICPLCQHSNKGQPARCSRCHNDFDTPIEKVKEQLRVRTARANELFAKLLVLDILLACLFFAGLPGWILLLVTGALVGSVWLTVIAMRRLDIWLHSAKVLSEKHGELPKATVVSK